MSCIAPERLHLMPSPKKNIPSAVPSIWSYWEQTERWNEQDWAADSLFALAQEFKALIDDEVDGIYLRDDISWMQHRTLSPAVVLPCTTRHSFLHTPAVWLLPHTFVLSGTLRLLRLCCCSCCFSCCCCRQCRCCRAVVDVPVAAVATATAVVVSLLKSTITWHTEANSYRCMKDQGLLDSWRLITKIWWPCGSYSALISE